MGIIIFWLILSFVVAVFGAERKIGFWGSLFLSLLLSPLIGLIGVALSERANTNTTVSPTRFLATAEKLIEANDFDRAISNLNHSLSHGPSPLSHYQLAVCYSQKHQEKTALLHLSKAVDSGFGDFNKIENDPYLSWLRNQPEYKIFAKNGYNSQPLEIKESRDTVSQLKDLAELFEKKMITEQEFLEQKAKLLN